MEIGAVGCALWRLWSAWTMENGKGMLPSFHLVVSVIVPASLPRSLQVVTLKLSEAKRIPSSHAPIKRQAGSRVLDRNRISYSPSQTFTLA